MRRVTVTLSAAAWRDILRAIDNGAWSGDPQLLRDMFPEPHRRDRFLSAFRAIDDAVGADYAPRGRFE